MCVYTFESYSCVIVMLWLVTVSQQSSNVLVMHGVHAASPLRHPMFDVLQATGGMADYIMKITPSIL